MRLELGAELGGVEVEVRPPEAEGEATPNSEDESDDAESDASDDE